MNLPTQPPPFPTYDFLRSYLDKQIASGATEEDAAKLFDHYFSHGYVFKSPHYLMFGGECPENPSEDCWYVAWVEYHPDYQPGVGHLSVLRHFLALMPYSRPFIKWERGLRGKGAKLFRTDRLRKLLYHHGNQA